MSGDDRAAQASRPRPAEQSAVARLCWYGAACAGVALVTLLIHGIAPQVQPSRMLMSYLLVVLALAIVAGRGPAVVASLLAFLAFDWFFVQPTGTFNVNAPDEWFALGLFLLVSVSTGSLAAALKRSADEAHRRTRETVTLYELSIAVLSNTALERVLHVIVERLAETLRLRAATILLLDDSEAATPAAHAGQQLSSAAPAARSSAVRAAQPARRLLLPQPSRAMLLPLEDAALSAGLRGAYAPLLLDDQLLGLLAAYSPLDAPPLNEHALRLVDAFAAQTALAIGRARLVAEEERTRAIAESDRLKSIFLASLSHDLRTPLTAIKTSAGVLAADDHDPADAAEAAASIDREVDRLNSLVGNLLDLSRIEGGVLAPRREPESLTELVGATAERCAPLLRGRSIELSAADELPLVAVDAMQFERVLLNLLENAIKFSPAGSAIRVALSADAAAVTLRVHSAGAPIPPAEQQRVFDKFYRLRRGDTSSEGAGLGLAICKGIVEAHAGRIWTANEEGGVAFYLQLPCLSADEHAVAEPVR